MKIQAMIAKIKVYFGQDELTVRRAGLDSIKPKLMKGCTMDVKHFETHDLYIFTPDKLKTDGAVVYYHGGGFTVMHVYTYQRFISNMAIELGCVVFSPEYRLAPEHPFPEGDTDVYLATKYIFDNNKEYKIDRNEFTLDFLVGFFSLFKWST